MTTIRPREVIMLRLNALFFVVVAAFGLAEAEPGMAQEPAARATQVTRNVSAALDPENVAAVENPTGVITLKVALALALLQSPDLRAYEWEIRAREAAVLQAGLRINPELSLEVEDIRWREGPGIQSRNLSITGEQSQLNISGGSQEGNGASAGTQIRYPSLKPSLEFERETGAHSGLSEAQFTLTLSKAVELGGKRIKRIRLAQREKDLAAWDYEVARANVMKEVAQAFIAIVAGQERVSLEQELVRIAQGSSETIGKLVDVGEVSPLELSKAETALSLAQIQLEQAREALESARARLVATWGGALAEFERAEGELTETRPVPPLGDLIDQITKNPDLARWSDELEQRLALVDLEKAKRIPNVTISAGLRRTGLGSRDLSHLGLGPGTQWNAARSQIDYDADAENTLYLGLSMPLPIFDRNQGAIQQAQHRASKAGEERRATESQLRASLAKTYHSLQAAYVTSTTLVEKVLPNATHTFESITKGYEQGEFSYIDVLDAQRTMFEARNQYLDALAAYHENAVEVERLMGTALLSEGDNANLVLDKPSE